MTAQPTQYTSSETYSRNILGTVGFTLSNLRVDSLATPVENYPDQVSGQTSYIMDLDERFKLSVQIAFHKSELTRLLLCLGTQMEVQFPMEGLGGKAAEVDASSTKVTQQDVYNYELSWSGTAAGLRATPGLYEISCVVNIGPVQNACRTRILGYGYVSRLLVQFYQDGL